MNIYLGTGGYSDADLVGALYPKNTKRQDFLAQYANFYNAVEINSSFYAPLGQKAFLGMLQKSCGKLRFCVKLHQDFSHTLIANNDRAKAFLQAVMPIMESGKLGALLLQFPASFQRTLDNRMYLDKVVRWFDSVPLAVEFRSPSWHIDKVVSQFHERELIMVGVDYPCVQGLPKTALYITHKIAYLRLHGRNLGWWSAKNTAERHDYLYSQAQMQNLAHAIMAHNVQDFYIFFQNTTKAQAVQNIAMLRAYLGLPPCV